MHDFAAAILERALKAGRALVAISKVVRHRGNTLHAKLRRRIVAEHVHRLRGRPHRVNHVIILFLLGEVFLRGGSWRYQRHARLPDVIVDGERFERGERTDDGMHVIALHQFLNLAFCLRGIAAGIPDDKLDLAPGERVIALLQEEQNALLHLRAARGKRSGAHGEKAEPERFALSSGVERKDDAQHKRCDERIDALQHACLLR